MGKDYVRIIYKEFKCSQKKVEEYQAFVIAKLLDLLEKGEPIHLDFEFLEQFSESSNRMAEADEQYWTERQAREGTSASETTIEGKDLVHLPLFDSRWPKLQKYVYGGGYVSETGFVPARTTNLSEPYFKIMAFFMRQYFENFAKDIYIREYDYKAPIKDQLLEYMQSTYTWNIKKTVKRRDINKTAERRKNIHGFFVVPTEFEVKVMEATYGDEYPNINWHTPQNVPKNRPDAKMVFAVLPYVTKTEKTDENGRVSIELEIDYDGLKDLLQKCNKLMDNGDARGCFLTMRSLQRADSDEWKETTIAEVNAKRLLDIIKQTKWSLELVGNGITDFFVLRKKQGGNASHRVAYLNNFEGITRETQLQDILKACYEKEDYKADREVVCILDEKALLKSNDFEAMIEQKKVQEWIAERGQQSFFQEVRGSDCIDRWDYYDLESDLPWEEENNAIYLPKSNQLFPVIGICYRISDICEKFCNKKVAFKDLELKGIPWFDYCQSHGVKDGDLKGSDILENAKLLKWEQLTDDWQFGEEEERIGYDLKCQNLIAKIDGELEYKHELAFLFGQHDLSLWNRGKGNKYIPGVENGVYIYNRKLHRYSVGWRIHRNSYEKGYTKFQLLVSQVVRANVVRVILNPKKLRVEYLKLYFQTEMGRRTLKLWQERPAGTPLDNFKELMFAFPPIAGQINIEKDYRLYNQKLKTYQDQMGEILTHIGGLKLGYYLVPEDMGGKKDKGVSSHLFQKLPQPLASIFYLSQCEHENARKVKNWLNFFEAAAIFHAMTVASILLASFRDNPPALEGAKKVIVEKLKHAEDTGEEGSEFNETFGMTFGTWTAMLREMGKKYRKEVDEVFDHDLNEKLLKLLNQGRGDFRNAGSAHSPRSTEPTEEDLCEACQKMADDICRIWVKLYGRTEILYDCHVREVDGEEATVMIEGYKAIGAHPRLKCVQRYCIEKKDIVDVDFYSRCLYIRLWRDKDRRFIRLLPFVCYRPLTDEDPCLMSAYYLDGIVVALKNKGNSYTKWRSLDCGDKGLCKLKYDEDQINYKVKPIGYDEKELEFEDKTTKRLLEMVGQNK